MELIAILSYPLLRSIFEESYSLSKPFGLAISTFLALPLSTLLPFSLSSYISVIFLAFLALIFWGKLSFGRSELKEEAIFLSAFALLLAYLSFKPEIYFAYSEDFVDFAFLKSILRFGFPLRDPWFGGEFLPYYFFGHAAAALLIALSGVKAEIGYNLAVAAYYSMAVQLSYSLGKSVSGREIYGFLSALFVCFAGFFSGFFQLLAFLFKTPFLGYKTAKSAFQWLLDFDFSAATRAIPGAVVFYPFFTFLQGDMHAHFMSIPFQIAFLLSAFHLYKDFSTKKLAATLFLLFFLLGTNAWSFLPALLLLTVIAENKRAKFLAFLVPSAILILIPAGILKFVEARTELLDFIQIFALFLVSTLLCAANKLNGKSLFLILVSFLVGFFIEFQLLFLFPVALLLLRERSFENLLAFIAILTLLFCELFYFDDPLGKPFERMNTLMKLYLSAWIFWGFSSALYLRKLEKKAIVVFVIFALSLVHPLASLLTMPNSKLLGDSGEITLDGMRWLKEKNLEEYEAIKWLENRSGMVLEAPGEAYTYSSRVSTFTGLPTVIGWRTHEIMWGKSWEEVNERTKDVDEIYLNGSLELIYKYKIKYIFFGEVERKRYGKSELDYPWLKVVFKKGNVTIYEVR